MEGYSAALLIVIVGKIPSSSSNGYFFHDHETNKDDEGDELATSVEWIRDRHKKKMFDETLWDLNVRKAL